MKYLVFAYNQVGYEVIKTLIKFGIQIAAIVTHEHNNLFDSIEILAQKHNIKIYKPEKLSNFSQIIDSEIGEIDIILSAYYKFIIPDDILNHAKIAALNMHGSLLPKYRGRCPINWAIINGETETGATLHHMISKIDGGDIVDQEKVTININDNALDVLLKICNAAKTILKRQIPLINLNIIARKKNDISAGSYFGGRSIKDSKINWQSSAKCIYDFIRALQPYTHYPSAFCEINNIEIIAAEIPNNIKYKKITPGTMLQCNTISCGQLGDERLVITNCIKKS